MENHHVITGGPGAGKTTLIAALAAEGYRTVAESGRRIIRAQTAIGGNALHTGDRRLYAELMLMQALCDHEDERNHSGPVFFDRGVIDLIGYCRLTGMPVPEHFRAAVRRYPVNRRVFVAPPWREIYATDGERKQDFAEAVATHDAMVAACQECGYEPVALPKTSVAERVAYVLADIAG